MTVYSTAFLEGLTPDPVLTVSEWADNHRFLSQKASSEPGRWRTSRTPYLREIMDALSVSSPVQKVVFQAGAQIGKALAIETPIFTPLGWRTMGDLSVGDQVFDDLGKPCRVVFATEFMRDRKCYRIRFSDGQEIVADADHRWTVDYSLKGRSKGELTLTTAEMIPLYKTGNRNNIAIPVCSPLEFKECEFPLDPYCLGAWLGDGNSHSAQITYHKQDGKIIDQIEAAGFTVLRRKIDPRAPNVMNAAIDLKEKRPAICERGHNTVRLGFDHKGRCRSCQSEYAMWWRGGKKRSEKIQKRLTFTQILRAMGLIGNKHIPQRYLRGSISQRWSLLQGLMDTDGHATEKGVLEFCSCNHRLADDFMCLAWGLGLKPVKRKKGKANIVTFVAYSDQQVFRLERKQNRLKARSIGRASEVTRRRIVEITETQSVPVRCIQVDSQSHLFLAGKALIPTHNTETGLNYFGYVVEHAPGPMLIVQPTVELAQKVSKQRIAPMIEESPRLRELIKDARSRDSGNTMLTKEFRGGVLMLTGANSAVGLRSMPIRFLFLDEVDAYPSDVEGEGDPVKLAERRTTTFSRRKVYMVSTPTIRDVSRIEREFLLSDQRRYFVPCPHCENMDWIRWSNIKFDPENTATVHLQCESCGCLIDEHNKTEMLLRGEWRPTADGDGRSAGYHLSSLYSPLGWKSWGEIVREFLAAKNDPPMLKEWVNTVLAETWEEEYSAKIGAEALAEKAEEYRLLTVPDGGLILTAGIDVQDNRIAVKVKAWGEDEESWLVNWTEIYGDPSDLSGEGPWAQVDSVLLTEYQHESGAKVKVMAAAVDTGGHFTHEAYMFCRMRKKRHVIAIKGSSTPGRSAIGKPSRQDVNFKNQTIKGGVDLWMIGTDTIKATVYARLKKAGESGAGCPHFPLGVSDEYYKQLTAEKQVTRFTNGHPRRIWIKKDGSRNEALDCEVYAYAALQYFYTRVNRANIWLQAKQLIDKLAPDNAKPVKAADADTGEQKPPIAVSQRQKPVVARKRGGFVNSWR
jgi:phage terminase large subunit GpA-like protein